MGILEVIGLFFSAIVAIAPTLLAHLSQKAQEHNELKKTSFDLGLSELDAANQRMRLDVDQHNNLTVQPGGGPENLQR